MLGGFSASSLIEGGRTLYMHPKTRDGHTTKAVVRRPTVSVVVVVLSFAFLLTPPPHCPHTHTHSQGVARRQDGLLLNPDLSPWAAPSFYLYTSCKHIKPAPACVIRRRGRR